MKKIITKTITIITMLVLAFMLAMPVTAQAKARPTLNKRNVTLTITKENKKPTFKLKLLNTSKKVKWMSTKKKVATVSKNGKVTAKKKGRTTIQAEIKTKSGTSRFRCSVRVKDARKSNNNPSKNPEPTPTPTPEPTPTPTPECQHTYEDHWMVLEEYYPTTSIGDLQTLPIACSCSTFTNGDDYEQHLLELEAKENSHKRQDWEICMGLHGASAKSVAGVTPVNGKRYNFIKTEYIDKRICTKCGVVRTTWDMPSARPSYRVPAITPDLPSVTPSSPEA